MAKADRYDKMNITELAEHLAQDCVVTKVLAKYLENVLRAVFEDHVKPLRDALETIREKASDRNNPQIAFIADKALKGEPLSPLRAGQCPSCGHGGMPSRIRLTNPGAPKDVAPTYVCAVCDPGVDSSFSDAREGRHMTILSSQQAAEFARRVAEAELRDPEGDVALLSRIYKTADDLAEHLRGENKRLREALAIFLGDKTLSEILWGDLPDDSHVKITIKLGAYRQAQAASNHQQTAEPGK